MDTPTFAAKEYVSPTIFNNAMTAIANNEALLAAGLSTGLGLISPDTLQFSFASLTINVTANSPFGILFPTSSGFSTLSQAHGTVTGRDTQAYSVSFSSLVPASGSVTAYLIASYVQIQQNAYQVIGPPPGHPDYNPNFVPYTAYSDTIDSFALTASTTPPNNSTTFALGYLTLTAGQSSITSINTADWTRIATTAGINFNPITTNKTLAYTDAGVWQQDTAGVTFTLPLSGKSYGLQFKILNATSSGNTTVQTQSPDILIGFPAGAGASVVLEPGQSVVLGAANGYYFLTSNVGGVASVGLTSSSAGIGISGSPLTKSGNIDIELASVLNTIAAQGGVAADVTYLGQCLGNYSNYIGVNLAGGFYITSNSIQLYATDGVACGVGYGNYLVVNYDGDYGLALGGAGGVQLYVWTGAGLTTGSGPVQVDFGQCIGNYGNAIGVNFGPMMQNYGNGIAPILGTGLYDSGNAITTSAWAWDQGGNPGYYEAPGGFIIQWGYVTVGGNQTADVNFAVTFPNTHVGIFFQQLYNGTTYQTQQLNGHSNSNFGIANGVAETTTSYWMALGW